MGRLMIAGLCVALLRVTIVLVHDVPLTGYATASLRAPSVFVNVSRPVFANDILAGSLLFNFSGPVAAKSSVKVVFGNVSKEYSFVSLLANASIPVVVVPRSA